MPCLPRYARGRTARLPEPGILRRGAWGVWHDPNGFAGCPACRATRGGGQPACLNRGFCAGALGEYGMTPTDLLDALPAALREGEDSPPA